MKSYKEIAEALKGNQHKIDKNKNGKIDAHDFKLLRKEEADEIVFKNSDEDEDENKKDKKEMKEAAPPGFEGTVKAMKKKKEIDNPYALAWSMYKKGYESHKNADGTMKEEAEQIDELTHEVAVSYDKNAMRAQGKVRVAAKDHEEARTKALDSMKGREKNVKAHSSRNLAAGKETDTAKFSEQAPVAPVPDRKYIKGTPEHKAYKATKKPINGMPTNVKEGYVVRYNNPKSEKHGSEKHFEDQMSAQKHADRGNSVDKIGGKYTVHKTNDKGHDMKEEYAQVTEGMMTTHKDPLVTVHDKHGLHTHANLSTANNIFGTKVKHTDVHAGAVNTKSRDGTALKFAISQHHAQAVKDEEKFKKQFGESKLSYKEFMEAMIATQVRPGVTRYTGGSYGSAKGAKYGNTDYDKETLDTKDDEGNDQQKRGRGRPAGAKSGARGPRIK